MSQVQDFPFDIEYVAKLLDLRIRRRCHDGVYTDCPFCGDDRGKMKINYELNVWRCNYCKEGGGMLKLYAMAHNITASEANREICDTILNGDCFNNYSHEVPIKRFETVNTEAPCLAEIPVIHKTLTALLGQLKLSEHHREHLRNIRGLSDEEIERLGYKSTPPYYMCKQLTDRLISLGYEVKGVPGFYMKNGQWTVNFSTILSGIILPARGVDGMIRGFQIRLDVPLKNQDDPKDKTGAKYVWLSSAGKPCGVSPGSPAHYVGEQGSRAVYLTEGILKADIAHFLMNRTFIAIAGINNHACLDMMLSYLARNGTQVIVCAADMDRFRNIQVSQGVNKLGIMVRKHGIDFRLLYWNPNYKGVDDWQLALKRKNTDKEICFKKRFIYGLCEMSDIEKDIALWDKSGGNGCELSEFLGFTEEEMRLYVGYRDNELKECLLSQRRVQKYRIYQLEVSDGKVIPFAFGGIELLHKEGHDYPPASLYRQTADGEIWCADNENEIQRLERLNEIYGDKLPEGYTGRCIAPSDVLELYDEESRRYFYRDEKGFVRVRFSPMLAKPLKNE